MHILVDDRLMKQIMLGTSLFCLGGGLLISIVLLFRQDGFGVNDFDAIFLWTFLFAIALGIIVRPASLLLVRIPIFLTYILATILGCLSAVLWATIVGIALGPYVGAFSIPPLPGWVVGGVGGMLTGTSILNFAEKKHDNQLSFLSVVQVVSIPLMIVTFLSLVLIRTSSSSTIIPASIIPVKWEPGSGPTRIDDPFNLLTEQEVSQLQSLGLGGVLTPESGPVDKYGNSRVVLVMQYQISESETLPLPDNANVIYIQTEGKWLVIPPDVPKRKQEIILEPVIYYNGDEATDYCIDVGPGLSCSGGIGWPNTQQQD